MRTVTRKFLIGGRWTELTYTERDVATDGPSPMLAGAQRVAQLTREQYDQLEADNYVRAWAPIWAQRRPLPIGSRFD